MTADRDLLEPLVALARSAGEITLRYYCADAAVLEKSDGSPVTIADRETEAHITDRLAALTPGIPVVGEEAIADGHRPDIAGGTFWLVDALDGTKEFINRRDEYTVNIGLIRQGAPVLGIVHAPALGTCYWGLVAGDGAGAWKTGPGQASVRPIRARAVPKAGAVVVASKSHRTPELEAYLAALRARQPVADETSIGSSLKFCLVAEGVADVYPRLGPTMEWDTAAGQAVACAAGAQVLAFGPDGRTPAGPLAYAKPDYRNPHFLVTGHPHPASS